MKKEHKLLALSLFSLLLIGTLVAALVSAADLGDAGNKIADAGSSLFSSWAAGNLDLNIAKLVFALMIMLVIYGISSVIPFIEDKWYMKWSFAILGTFLATAYLTPSEVYVMLSSWSAMGVTFGVVIPFLLVAAFVYKLSTSADTSPEIFKNKMLAYAIWIIYAVAMASRMVVAYVNPPENFKWGSGVVIISILCIGLSILALIMNGLIFKKMRAGLEATTRGAAAEVMTKSAEDDILKAIDIDMKAGKAISKKRADLYEKITGESYIGPVAE